MKFVSLSTMLHLNSKGFPGSCIENINLGEKKILGHQVYLKVIITSDSKISCKCNSINDANFCHVVMV